MLIADKVAQARAYINYDNNKDIRESLENPYDFHRAVEYGLTEVGKLVPIIHKTIFIPLNSSTNKQLLFNLEKLGLPGFKMVKPLQIYHVLSTMEAIKISDECLDRIKEDTYINLSSLYYDRPYNSTVTITTTTEPVLGTYGKIIGQSSTSSITSDTTFTAGTKVLNLSKALNGVYSFATPASTNVTSLMDKTVNSAPYSWAIGDKLYMSATECSVIAIVLQLIPDRLYFDTYTLPVYNQSADSSIDTFVYLYLLNIIKSRFPEYIKMYTDLLTISTKLVVELISKIVYSYEQIWFEKQ